MSVIDPKFFYLVHLCDSLRTVCGVFLASSIVFTAVFLLYCGFNDSDAKYFLNGVKKIAPFFIIPLIVIIFVPTKDTAISMLVAKYVTYDMIDGAKDAVIDFVQQIVDVITSAK